LRGSDAGCEGIFIEEFSWSRGTNPNRIEPENRDFWFGFKRVSKLVSQTEVEDNSGPYVSGKRKEKQAACAWLSALAWTLAWVHVRGSAGGRARTSMGRSWPVVFFFIRFLLFFFLICFQILL
jgi:hypothetical protein